MTTTIAQNLKLIHQRINETLKKCERSQDSVKLIAVSKQQDILKIKEAIAAKQYLFAENYVQEALPKIKALAQYPLEWHYIGVIQSNKTKAIAENFNWVHSLNRIEIAHRLNNQRPLALPPLNVCIEVNLDYEKTKAGIYIESLIEFAEQVKTLKQLHLRGLMTIPKPRTEFNAQLQVYQKLQNAIQFLNNHGILVDTLSMGMSDDFEAAIAAGSTMVRIGSAIFGKRNEQL